MYRLWSSDIRINFRVRTAHALLLGAFGPKSSCSTEDRGTNGVEGGLQERQCIKFWPSQSAKILNLPLHDSYLCKNRTSPQFATINLGIAACARSASRARLSRFDSFTWGTRRKIGTELCPRPVLEREATPRPRLLSRPSATSRLGPPRR